MADLTMFEEAQEAAKQGQRERARDLLTRLLKTEKDNIDYWLLMSSVVDSSKERIYCLQSVLRADPENLAARQGLVLLGALAPDESLQPALPIRRKWEVEIDEGEELTGFRKVMANPVVRVVSFAGAGILVVGLVLLGIFAPKGTIFGPRLTITPVAWTPTPTQTETPTPLVRTPTPTPATAVPLWMLLEATYTPVPVYVNTPHPLSEAYRSAMRAYERGDFQSMLDFMLQAQQQESDSPDTYYHVGEAHRLLEEYDQAITAYEQALDVDPEFAPAYLARARARLALNPKTNVLSDLEAAIEYDPAFGEAYLALAEYQYAKGEDAETVLEIMNQGETSLAHDPHFYLLRAQLRLALGDPAGALEDAMLANEMDITILESYLVLGQAYLANDMPEEALEVLTFYGRYEDENPLHWALLGWAYHGVEDYEAAIESLDKAVELDNQLYEAFLYRGLTYLDMGETQNALNDLYTARRLSPKSFEANYSYALALVGDGRLQESLTHFDVAEGLAKSDQQLALVYYNRALVYDALNLPNRAKEDFTLLIQLKPGAAPRIWIVKANSYLATATPTSTFTLTPIPSKTPTPTRTFTVTPSPTKTFTPSPTITPSRTPTPTATSTYTLTPTPTATITNTITPSRTPSPTP